MRYFKIVSDIAVLMVVSVALQCQESQPTDQNDPRFYGTWNWVQTAGGDFVYQVFTPPPAIDIVFKKDNLCTFYRNDTLVSDRRYYSTCDTVSWHLPDAQNIITFAEILLPVPYDSPAVSWRHAPAAGEKCIYGFSPDNDTLTIGEVWYTYIYTKKSQ